MNAHITDLIPQEFVPHLQNDLSFVLVTATLLYVGAKVSLKTQQQIQNNLNQEKTYHEQVLAQLPLVVWTTDLKLQVKSASGTGLNFLPYIATKSLQSSAQPFLDNYECYIAHQKALQGQQSECIVYFGQHYFDVRIKPLSSDNNQIIGCVATAVDLTDNIQMQMELLESESRFRSLVSSMDDMIYTLDTKQKHTGVYGRWIEANDLSPAMFLGKTSEEILGTHMGSIHTMSNHRALTGQTVVYNWYSQQQDGYRYYQTRLSPIYDNKHQVSGLVGVGRDITELKQAGQALEEYRLQLESKVEARTQALEQEMNERIRVQKEESKQRRIAEALRDLALILTKPLELEVILDHAINTLQKLIAFDGVTIMLMDNQIVHTVRVMYKNDAITSHYAGFDPMDIPYLRHLATIKQADVFDPTMSSDISMLSNKHQWIKAAIGSPILISEEVCGFVITANGTPDSFTVQDLETMTFFSTHIAAAIQNSRLLQTIQQKAVEDERTRIAHELHDAVTQTLFSANILSETLLTLSDDMPTKVNKGLKSLQHLTRGALAEMRTLLLELRPKKIQAMSLESLAKQLSEAFYSRTQIPVQVSADQIPIEINLDVKLNLYRIIQESLNNIDKHARANHVYIQIQYDGDKLQMCIEDDGIGFDTTHNNLGMGLSIIQERAHNIQSTITIESQPEKGTTICILIFGEKLS